MEHTARNMEQKTKGGAKKNFDAICSMLYTL